VLENVEARIAAVNLKLEALVGRVRWASKKYQAERGAENQLVCECRRCKE
jgi:hypothetical protein